MKWLFLCVLWGNLRMLQKKVVTWLIFMWNHLIQGHFHIYYACRILWSSTRTHGQLRSPTARSPRKIMENHGKSTPKHSPQKRGRWRLPENAPFFWEHLGRKIPKCLLLRVIKNETRWKLRSMFTPPKKNVENHYVWKEIHLQMLVFELSCFGRVVVKSNTLWTLHPTANEKQQNWHLCYQYILILAKKN